MGIFLVDFFNLDTTLYTFLFIIVYSAIFIPAIIVFIVKEMKIREADRQKGTEESIQES